MQGPSPAAFDSADAVPASYCMIERSITPSERWREVWSRTFSVLDSLNPKTFSYKRAVRSRLSTLSAICTMRFMASPEVSLSAQQGSQHSDVLYAFEVPHGLAELARACGTGHGRHQVAALRLDLFPGHRVLGGSPDGPCMVPELPPVFQPDFDDALPAGHRPGERVVADELHAAAQLEDRAIAHASRVVRGLESHAAVREHHGAQVLHADIGHMAVVGGVRSEMGDAHDEPLDLPGAYALRADQFQQRIERGLDRRSDRPALDVGVHDLVALAELARELRRVGRVPVGDEEIALARKDVLDAGEAVRDHRRRLHAVARGHAAEVEGLLDVLFVAHPAGDAGVLLRRVGKLMPHAALVQLRERARGRGRPEGRPDAVPRMSHTAELDGVQRLRHPAAP